MVKSAISHISDEGMALRELLQKAAGLQNHKLRSLECRIATGEPVTFKAELLATKEDVREALGMARGQTPEEMIAALEGMK